MKEIQSIGVYCSSYNNLDPIYNKAAEDLGQQLATRGITMIYGGGAQGLMGIVANTVMANKGKVIGFMPHHLKEFEDPNWAITEMHLVDTMHTRKRLMFEHSDAFIILPGGFGTLDETFELITWRQLKLHQKPVVFINVNQYWMPLKDLTGNIFSQGFAKDEDKVSFKFVNSIAEAFQILTRAPEPPASKPVAKWV